jgi:hypothetical protein
VRNPCCELRNIASPSLFVLQWKLGRAHDRCQPAIVVSSQQMTRTAANNCAVTNSPVRLTRRLPLRQQQITDASHRAQRRSPAMVGADFAAQPVDVGIERAIVG